MELAQQHNFFIIGRQSLHSGEQPLAQLFSFQHCMRSLAEIGNFSSQSLFIVAVTGLVQ